MARLDVSRLKRRQLVALIAVTGVVIGWLCITAAIAVLSPRVVWPLSIGILLITLTGWRGFVGLALEGVFPLIGDRDA